MAVEFSEEHGELTKQERKQAEFDKLLSKHRKQHGSKWMGGKSNPEAGREWIERGHVHQLFITYWGNDGSGWKVFPHSKKNPAKLQYEKFLKTSDSHVGEIRTALFIDNIYVGSGDGIKSD